MVAVVSSAEVVATTLVANGVDILAASEVGVDKLAASEVVALPSVEIAPNVVAATLVVEEAATLLGRLDLLAGAGEGKSEALTSTVSLEGLSTFTPSASPPLGGPGCTFLSLFLKSTPLSMLLALPLRIALSLRALACSLSSRRSNISV